MKDKVFVLEKVTAWGSSVGLNSGVIPHVNLLVRIH